MHSRLLTFLVLCATTFSYIWAADDEATPKTNMKEVLKARMAEEAKKNPAPASPPKSSSAPVNPTATAAPTGADAKTNKPADAKPAATESPATTPAKDTPAKPPVPTAVLPKVEVKRDRITVLDQQLAKQEQDIARERKNLKPSEVDTALNDSKISKPLALFGGESTQFRQRVASERVELMEAEKDIMEAMARAKTKEEKQELQKQLDQIRGFRRDLEKSMR